MKNVITSIEIVARILMVSGWMNIVDINDVAVDPVWDEIEFSIGGSDYRLRLDEDGTVWQCHTSSAREPGYMWTEWEYAGGEREKYIEIMDVLDSAYIRHNNPIMWWEDPVGDINLEDDDGEFEISIRETDDGLAICYRKISEEGETRCSWTEWELI